MSKEKIIDLYTIEQLTETNAGMNGMAIRFKVRNKDVIHALWTIAKDTVWSKLLLDVNEEKGGRLREDE